MTICTQSRETHLGSSDGIEGYCYIPMKAAARALFACSLRFGIANDYLTWMQAHPDELLSLLKQFAGKRYGEVGPIPNLLLLSPASQYQNLSSQRSIHVLPRLQQA